MPLKDSGFKTRLCIGNLVHSWECCWLTFILPKSGVVRYLVWETGLVGGTLKMGQENFESSITRLHIPLLCWNLICWCSEAAALWKSTSDQIQGSRRCQNLTCLYCNNCPTECSISLKFGVNVHCWSMALASWLTPRMTGGTGGLKWQCIVNCHLFWLSLWPCYQPSSVSERLISRMNQLGNCVWSRGENDYIHRVQKKSGPQNKLL